MIWILLVVGTLALYQVAVLIALLAAWRRTRVAPRRTPADLGVAYEDVQIPTANRRVLRGWFISGGDGRRPAVVLVHGWGRNVERMLPYVAMLHPAGLHLLAFDARHHGASDPDGHASMKKFSEDIRAAVDDLTARPDVDRARIAVLGLSIGGSAAIHAAAHDRRIRAVVTVGAFAHPREAMLQTGLGSPLLAPALPLAFRFIEWRIGARFDDLAPERHIGRVAGRVLLVHGEDDRVVEADNAGRLARAAGGRAETWLLRGRGHSDPHLEPGFAERLVRFLGEALDGIAARKAGAA
jgi:uncharacterized protein